MRVIIYLSVGANKGTFEITTMLFKNLKVSVLFDNQTAEEYDIEETGDVVTCYIEAKENVPVSFKIQTIEPNFPRADAVSVALKLDGQWIKGTSYYGKKEDHITETASGQKMTLNTVNLVPSREGENINGMGSIMFNFDFVRVKKKQKIVSIAPCKTTNVKKDYIKLNPVTHAANFSAPTIDQMVCVDTKVLKPICTMVFKYRSYEILVAEKIIEAPVKIESENEYHILRQTAINDVLEKSRKRKAEIEATEIRKRMAMHKSAYPTRKLASGITEVDLTEEPSMQLIRYTPLRFSTICN